MMDAVPLEIIIEAKERRDPLQGLVILDGDLGGDTIQTALNKMAGHKILAAPVSLPGGSYAMVDLAGMALALVNNVQNASLPISLVCASSEQGVTLDVDNNLSTLVTVFADKGIHRVLITKDGKPYNLLSQMDVIRHICSFPEITPEGAKKLTVTDMLSTRNPLCVNRKENVGSALKKCIADCFSGVAVVDDDGKIFANFSISDLRAAHSNMEYLLSLNVEQYLKKTHVFAKLPVTATEGESFSNVVRLLAQHHVHRIHIVGDDEKPVGIVTTSDIIKALKANDRPQHQT